MYEEIYMSDAVILDMQTLQRCALLIVGKI